LAAAASESTLAGVRTKLPIEWRWADRHSGRYRPAPCQPAGLALQLWQSEIKVDELFAEIRQYKSPLGASALLLHIMGRRA